MKGPPGIAGRSFFFASGVDRRMKALIPTLAALPALWLAACSNDAVERPTEAETEQMDEMEAMLDELGEGGDVVANAVTDQP